MDNLNKAHKKIANQRRRAKAFKEHQEHTRMRRERIGELVGVPVRDMEELLILLKRELRYIKA